MKKVILEKLLENLNKLKDLVASEVQPQEGICYHAKFPHDKDKPQLILLIHSLFEKWPKFSGRILYPVPGVQDYTAERSFTRFPKWSGEYGELRKELLEFMILELEYELNTSWITKQKNNIITYIEGFIINERTN